METTNKLMLVARQLHKMNNRPKLSTSSFGAHLSNKYNLDSIKSDYAARSSAENNSSALGKRG